MRIVSHPIKRNTCITKYSLDIYGFKRQITCKKILLLNTKKYCCLFLKEPIRCVEVQLKSVYIYVHLLNWNLTMFIGDMDDSIKNKANFHAAKYILGVNHLFNVCPIYKSG